MGGYTVQYTVQYSVQWHGWSDTPRRGQNDPFWQKCHLGSLFPAGNDTQMTKSAKNGQNEHFWGVWRGHFTVKPCVPGRIDHWTMHLRAPRAGRAFETPISQKTLSCQKRGSFLTHVATFWAVWRGSLRTSFLTLFCNLVILGPCFLPEMTPFDPFLPKSAIFDTPGGQK